MSDSEEPVDPQGPTHPLTKPVYQAGQRAIPHWVSWALVVLPSLAVLGTWLVGKLPVFHCVAIVLLIAALWDWSHFSDRSRTMVAILGLSCVLLVSGSIAWLVGHPDFKIAGFQSLVTLAAIALAIALVQLYRSSETVLTLVRGWMVAVVILAGITLYQRLSRDLPALNGPFPSPGYLAGSVVAGLALMPIGFALEDRRALKWTYPVTAVAATWVVWTTHRSVGFGCALVILFVWLALWRRYLAVGVLVIAGIGVVVFRRVIAWRWSGIGQEPPLPWSVNQELLSQAMDVCIRSGFIGVGPGGLTQHWDVTGYAGPYSAFMELIAEYGLGAGVVVLCAFGAVLVWCVQRLIVTRGRPLNSSDRSVAIWVGLMILMLPWLTSLQATWLSFPMAGLTTATIAMLARHIEAPHTRDLQWDKESWLGKH